MLVAMSLIAVFLYATVLPLRNAIDARRGSRSLRNTSAQLRAESYYDSTYKQIGYDPRPQSRVTIAPSRPVPAWLRPLGGEILKLSADAEIKSIPRALSASLVREIAEMPNLRVLFIVLHPLTNADAAILAESNTLRYMLLRKTAITEAGAKALSEAMPNCVINRD
jgi:hypothetical protein